MEFKKNLGKISSFQSMGTVDGPGVRYIVFMQGCPIRCIYCHNPETWDINGGDKYSTDEVFEKIKRYIPYFQNNGGVTFSGGEPLLQNDFINEILLKCKKENIHTVIDTSGMVPLAHCKDILDNANLIILDIKANNNEEYKSICGGSLDMVLEKLDYLEKIKKPVWIRRVILPTLNDSVESIEQLALIIKKYHCIEKVELLPFRKLCIEKYRELNLNFNAEKYDEADDEEVKLLENHLKICIKSK